MNVLEYSQSLGWIMTIHRQPGIRLLIGKLPHPGVDVTVRNAWGDPVVVCSGSKPEHGPGGFEVPIWTTGLYTIRFLDQTFKVNVGNETVTVTFTFSEQTETGSDARLVSRWRPVEDTRVLWQRLQEMAEFAGLFSLEERVEPPREDEHGDWQMDVDRQPGPRLIVGRLPEPSIPVIIADPWGNETYLISGSKPEHGPGGFDVPVWRDVLYTIRLQGQRFSVEVRNDTVFVTFTRPGSRQGRLTSAPMLRSAATEIFARLQDDSAFRGVFSLEDAPVVQPERMANL